MIASIFVIFVAAGITVASVVYSFGGLFPFLAALTTLALIFQCLSVASRKTEEKPATVSK